MMRQLRKLVPASVLHGYHYALAHLGAFLYGFPSKNMIVIGVTGTSGKSTVVDLTTGILKEAGYRVAALSSIKFTIGEREWENKLTMTMPGRLKLQRFLRDAANAHCRYAVLEVTSEGIQQHRHRAIDFSIAAITNLSPEHIESHGSFEKYRKAKEALFRKTKHTHILNADDEQVGYFLQYPAEKKYLYQFKGHRVQQAEQVNIIEAENITTGQKGVTFKIQGVVFNLNLLGAFNISNALAAICIGLSQGISLETCKKALEKVEGIPGRMEIVVREPFFVIVDYAHTPAALEEVYREVKRSFIFGSASLRCVLGACGGGRDIWKRPVLGKIAARYCTEVIVTNEDPYEDDPGEIIEQVAKGAAGKAKKIEDRRVAIREALKKAKPHDVVVITGKGSELFMRVAKGKKIPWDDREIVREEFYKIKGYKVPSTSS